jgi:hypothetical protein
MNKFYFLLWLKWAIRLSLSSVVWALFFASIFTIFIYVFEGMPKINSEILEALFNVLKFWFPIIWNITLLLALFRSLKYIFNTPINGFCLKLLDSQGGYIENIGYGNLVQIWRKWFMLNIWLVSFFMILALIFTKLFTSFSGVFEWFNIYWLFVFVLLSGYFSFIILGARCKSVKIIKC